MAELVSHAVPQTAAKSWRMPDTLVLIFVVGLVAALLSYFIPAGYFATDQVSYLVDGVEKVRTVIDPESFAYATDDNGHLVYNAVRLFAVGSETGIMNFAFAGLTSS